MHYHFEEGHGRYADILEVVGIFSPGLAIPNCLLLSSVIGVEGIAVGFDQLNSVFELFRQLIGHLALADNLPQAFCIAAMALRFDRPRNFLQAPAVRIEIILISTLSEILQRKVIEASRIRERATD